MERHVSELYVTALPQTKWRVGGCAHWNFCVCPSLRFAFPYPMKTRGYEVDETNVKPMWTLSQWQRCEAQSYEMMCNRNKCICKIIPGSFISTFFIFTCLCIAVRERVSVVGCWCFWCFGFICYMGSYLCVYEFILRRSLAMLEGHSFSYKVVFSLLIAVYSLGWKWTMWTPSNQKNEWSNEKFLLCTSWRDHANV